MDYQGMMTNQAKTQGRKNLYPYTFGVIGSIISIEGYDADRKVQEISQALSAMDHARSDGSLPWDTKIASAPTEAVKKNSHLDCIMDASKIEPLVDPAWAKEILKQGGI